MNKTIRNVFLVIGVLLLCLIVWFFVFGNGVSTIYNGIASVINPAWHNVAGSEASDIIPDEWGDEYNKSNIDDANDAVNGI